MRSVVAVIMGAALCLAPAGPASAIALQVEPAAQVVGIGSSVTVDLVVSGLGAGTAPSLSVFDVTLSFDSVVLSFLGAAFGDPFLGDQLDQSGLATAIATPGPPGTVSLFELSFDGPDDLNALQADSFILVRLTFEALAAGVSDLGLAVNDLGDASGDALSAETLDGKVSVGAVAAVSRPPSLLLLVAAGGAVAASSIRRRPRRCRSGAAR